MKKGLIIATVIVVVVLIFVGLLALKTFSIIGNFKSQMKKHTQMSIEELSALNDEELFSAISDRVDDEIYYSDDVESALANANKQKQIFYTAYWYEAEVNNGGLCQYFTNSSRATAPYLSEALEIIGAIKHKEHFDKFIDDNNIDVNDLSMFEREDVDEFEEKTKIFDFDKFDEKFYELGSIEEYLVKYARENIDKF